MYCHCRACEKTFLVGELPSTCPDCGTTTVMIRREGSEQAMPSMREAQEKEAMEFLWRHTFGKDSQRWTAFQL